MNITQEIESMFDEMEHTSVLSGISSSVRICDTLYCVDHDDIEKESIYNETKIAEFLKNIKSEKFIHNYIKKISGIF